MTAISSTSPPTAEVLYENGQYELLYIETPYYEHVARPVHLQQGKMNTAFGDSARFILSNNERQITFNANNWHDSVSMGMYISADSPVCWGKPFQGSVMYWVSRYGCRSRGMKGGTFKATNMIIRKDDHYGEGMISGIDTASNGIITPIDLRFDRVAMFKTAF